MCVAVNFPRQLASKTVYQKTTVAPFTDMV